MAERRAVMRAAAGLVAAALGLLPMSGCRWLPERRPSAALDPRQPDLPALEGAGPPGVPLAARRPAVPPPETPLRPLTDAEVLGEGPATPALDAALARAEGYQDAIVAELAPEPPRPEPPRPLPELANAAEPPAPRDEAVAHASAMSGPEPAVEPETAWRQAVEALVALAREQARGGPDPGGLWSARAEVLARLAESDGPDAPDALWRTVLSALAEPEGDSAAEPEAESPTPAPEPDPGPPALAIPELVLCGRVDGFGLYEPAAPDALRAGREVLLYGEVEGLAATEEGGQFRTRLASTVSLLPAAGDAPVWTRPLGTAEDACRRRRRDYFVNGRVALPADLPPGPYRLRLDLDDLNSGRSVAREIPVTLAP
jgi:hypothetical protein